MHPRLASLVPAGPALRRWRRLLRRHRRPLTAALAAATLLTALHSIAPAGPASTDVVVAASDLPGGTVLTAQDLRLAALPPADAPTGALTLAGAEGRTLAAPVRRGEPVTDVRVLGPRLVDALGAGLVAVPVRIADPAVVALLHAGDRVDVLAAPADPSTGSVTTVTAAGVRVLAVPAPAETAVGIGDGALVVLATTRGVAAALAAASTSDRLSVTLLSG